MEDIDIICRQSGFDKDKVKKVFNKNNKNVVDTICELNQIQVISTIKPVSTNPTDPLVLDKLNQLRTIVDEKDAFMDNLTQKTT